MASNLGNCEKPKLVTCNWSPRLCAILFFPGLTVRIKSLSSGPEVEALL